MGVGSRTQQIVNYCFKTFGAPQDFGKPSLLCPLKERDQNLCDCKVIRSTNTTRQYHTSITRRAAPKLTPNEASTLVIVRT